MTEKKDQEDQNKDLEEKKTEEVKEEKEEVKNEAESTEEADSSEKEEKTADKEEDAPKEEATPQAESDEDVKSEEKDGESSEEGEDEADTDDIFAIGEDEEFDWGEEEDYTKAEREKMEKMYESTLSSVEEGTIVTGTVVEVGEKDVVLNIGFKSEGLVPTTEFRDIPDVKPGDDVEVYLESIEDDEGQLVLSRRRAKHMRTWDLILEAEKNDVILEGIIKRRTKGGFVTDIGGIEAFLPGSQIDVKPVRDFDAYVGKKMDFKVVKVNQQFDNVVVSHKVLIEKDLEKQRQEILKNLEKGQVLEGTVKNMTNFGVFIDLGGVDGLLHITDISWGRINHPEEVLDLDQKIEVVVLDFDDDKKRISLGLKQLQPHPWDSLSEDVQEGSQVKGRVVTVADYGVFVEIMPGVEGLIHLSEMSWSQHLKDPSDLYKIGDEVEATIISIDREEHKMSLGVKQNTEDPWNQALEKYPVGSKHTGIVRGMTNYGLFVELEEGIDGLVHISDFSWTKKYSHPSEFIQKDEDLEVIVLDIDVENRRLSLGHKQLTEDVWETFESIFQEGTEHTGSVLTRNDNGATVELEYGIEGFIPARHLDTEEGKDDIKVGDSVKAKVIEFDKDAKKLVLSHTMTWNEEMEVKKPKPAKKKKKKTSGSRQPKTETTLLGDIDALQALKEQMETSEKEEKKEKKTTTKSKKKEEEKDDKSAKSKTTKADKKEDSKEEEEKEEKKVKKPAAKKKTTAKKSTAKKAKDDASDDEDDSKEEEKDKKKAKKPAAKKKTTTKKSASAKKDEEKDADKKASDKEEEEKVEEK